MWADHVDEAADAGAALELMAETDYEVVLCDYNLGDGKDGMQLFEEAKHLGLLHSHTVFLMITAENSMDNVMAVVEYLPDGYLVKPVNPEVLRLRITKAIQRKAVLHDIESALAESRYKDVIALCDSQLRSKPQYKFDLLQLRGEALLGNGDIQSAQALYDSVLETREIPWALLGRAQVLLHSGDLEAARKCCTQVIDNWHTTMQAYDLLARIESERGDTKACEQVLATAVSVSPKSIRRQQQLADTALDNGNDEAAQAAFRKALRLGRHSCFARGGDLTGFTRSTSAVEGPEAALRALEDVCKQDAQTMDQNSLAVQLARGDLLSKLDRGDEAKACIHCALEQLDADAGSVDPDLQLQLARACFDVGLEDEASSVVDHLVRTNHDVAQITDAAKALFHEVGRGADGDALVNSARKAIITINNDGVRLAKDGRFDEAVDLLGTAVNELPDNITVRLNLVQALLHRVKRHGMNPEVSQEIQNHLEKARGLGADKAKLARLLQSCNELSRVDADEVA